jgi:hypothetical protein
VNEKTENIGARRLYTVMEKLLEEVPSMPAATAARRSPSTPPTSMPGACASEDWQSYEL